MNPFTKDILAIIYALLPGFVAAWVFYGLTPHPKKEPFERVVQALIFTAIVQAVVYIAHWYLGSIGSQGYSLGEWNEQAAFVWSIALATLIGFLFAGMANNDWPHSWIRRRSWHFCTEHETAKTTAKTCRHWIWSRRTSYPSEWFGAFNRERRYVILHFADGRRLEGWPEGFPDQPEAGHFVMYDPQWLLPDGSVAPLSKVDRMLIPVASILMVEIMKKDNEITVDAKVIEDAENLLINSNEGDKHGESSTTTGPSATDPATG